MYSAEDGGWSDVLSKSAQKRQRRAQGAEMWDWFHYGKGKGKGGGSQGGGQGGGYGKGGGMYGKSTPKGGGKSHDGGAKGGHGKGKGDANARSSKWQGNADRGTYILCPRKTCRHWVWCDKAGSGCELCGTPYNYKEFWEGFGDCRTEACRMEEDGAAVGVSTEQCPAGDDVQVLLDSVSLFGDDVPALSPSAAASTDHADAGKGKGGPTPDAAAPQDVKGKGKAKNMPGDGRRWGKEQQDGSTASHKRDVAAAWKAVGSTNDQIGGVEEALVSMGSTLSKKMEDLKEYADRIAAKKKVLEKLQEEQKGAYQNYSAKICARDAAITIQKTDIGNQVAASYQLVGTLLEGRAQVAATATPPVQVKEEVVEKPPDVQLEVAQDVAQEVSPTADEKAQEVGLFPDSGGAMDPPNAYDPGGDDEVWGSEDEGDDEGSVVEVELDTLEAWKVHMAQWVFEAKCGEGAPDNLVQFFCGSGEGCCAIAKDLGEQIDSIRNQLWEEQLGAAKDAEAIRKVEAAGDKEAGYQMRCTQGLYAEHRFASLRDDLYKRLDTALEGVHKARQTLVDSGDFVAIKTKVAAKRKKAAADPSGKRPRKGADCKKDGVAMVQFQKKKVADALKGAAKSVKGHSATDAVAEQSQGK